MEYPQKMEIPSAIFLKFLVRSRYNVAFTKKPYKFVFPTLLETPSKYPIHSSGDMSQYLLLRSNKQSGPFTLEEIRAMGLKAYDLIWIEGKSAAWRYPGEIDELKSFAPAVEEQPFDRFFKKPTFENKPFPTLHSAAPSMVTEKDKRSSLSADSNRTTPPSNPQYVNLPASSRPIVEFEKNQAFGETDKKPQQKEQPSTQREAPTRSFSRSLPLPADDLTPLEEKFSQPLDDIKKQYVEKVLNRKSRVRPAGFSIRPAVLGVILIGLLGTGIIIGLTINKKANNSTQKDITRDLSLSDQPIDEHTRTIPVSSSGRTTDKRAENEILSQSEQNGSNLTDAQKEQAAQERKKAKILRQKAADSVQHLVKTAPVIDSSAIVAQREAARRADALLARDAVKNNITNYVFLSASKFNVGTFGGISDLQITVSNRSLYTLDLVVVEVQYIQSNKKVFKTENLYFHNIGAGSAMMEEAPKSPRGIKVQYRIALINSKDLGLAYTGM
jgi:cytoskeletal protein RodZ